MKQNVGTIERIIRGLIGIVAVAAYFLGWLQGTAAIIALVVGVVMLFTAIVGWCPPYAIFGINTAKKGDA